MSTDLSSLAKNSMWPTSQAGGNMTATNDQAMTAPGSQPVDKLRMANQLVQSDPEVEMGPQLPKGPPGPWHSRPHDDGEPASGSSYSPPAPSWKNTPSHSS